MIGLAVLAIIALAGICTSIFLSIRKLRNARRGAQRRNGRDTERQDPPPPPTYEREAENDPRSFEPGMELETNMSNFLDNCPVQASLLRDHGLPDECSWCHNGFDDLDSVRMFKCKHAIHYTCAQNLFLNSEPRCIMCTTESEDSGEADTENELPTYKESQKASKLARRQQRGGAFFGFAP